MRQLFHTDKPFGDISIFYSALYGHVFPLFKEESVYITIMFIYEEKDETTGKIRPYGRYRLDPKLKKIEEFEDEYNFLEKYRLYLDDPQNEKHSIHRMYHRFYNEQNRLEVPTVEGILNNNIKTDLKPINLEPYFGEKAGRNIPSASEKTFGTRPEDMTQRNFDLAEAIMVNSLLEDFDPHHSYYHPLPIICRGYLVGVAYFIYENKPGLEKDPAQSLLTNYRSLILTATREYESIIRDYDVNHYGYRPAEPLQRYQEIFMDKGIFPDGSPHYFEEIRDDINGNIISENSFLVDLGYVAYYKRMESVLIQESKTAIEAAANRLKNATTSIVVDSFAHNIGAHALIALKWWFENRAKMMDTPFSLKDTEGKLDIGPRRLPAEVVKAVAKQLNDDNIRLFYREILKSDSDLKSMEVSLLDLIRFMHPKYEKDILTLFDDKGNRLGRLPVPLDYTLFHFFQYLRDKSAFWSGAARDAMFGGGIRGWHRLIRKFVANSLFLGSISYSEGINKVNIFIDILDRNGKPKASGEFALIDISIMQREMIAGQKIPEQQPYSSYAFLRPGKKFSKIQDMLKKLPPVFLPNNLIGQQAFFTLLENTLRNVKHYDNKTQQEMIEGGLNFCISIQEMPIMKWESGKDDFIPGEHNLYRVGVWLHHKQPLTHKEGSKHRKRQVKGMEDKGLIINDHTQQLQTRLLDENGAAVLGGSSQDKICASVLFNNTFSSIEDMNLRYIKRHYYPYVYAASENWVELAQRIDVDSDRPGSYTLHKIYNPDLARWGKENRTIQFQEELQKYYEEHKERSGILKKYFHVWKGENCKILFDTFEAKYDNISRFKLVAVASYKDVDGKELKYHLPPDAKDKSAFRELRKEGLVRLIEADGYLQDTGRYIEELCKKGETPDEKLQQQVYEHAMPQWLGGWLNDTAMSQTRIGVKIQRLRREETNEYGDAGLAYLEQTAQSWEFHYLNLSSAKKANIDASEFHEFRLQHGKYTGTEASGCRVRSHGAFAEQIYGASVEGRAIQDKDLSENKEKAFKLIETLLTHITIFDGRLHDRFAKLDSKVRDAIQRYLRIEVFPEDVKDFKDNKARVSQKPGHFVIMHLAFIEKFTYGGYRDTQARYKESDVRQFFEQELCSSTGQKMPENSMLIVTSGRGRGDWIEKISHPQISFRPIEDIADAIEDGISMKDDFQIKFNLCNVLFGS